MSGSRKSLKSIARQFNPRAENDWSKDDSKFGQRMLEKMGWTKGQGVGRDNQGITENIKLRLKFDNKGLGFKITDADHLCEIESNFAHVLSNLSRSLPEEKQIDDCSPKIRSKTRKAYSNQNIIEGTEMDNLNLASQDNVSLPLESENNEQHDTYKTKKRKAKIVEIVEDVEDNTVCTEQNISSKLCRIPSALDNGKCKKTSESRSINIISSDCSEIVGLEVTNNDDKHKTKSRSRKKLENDVGSEEISTGIEFSNCDNRIALEKINKNHKYTKKLEKIKKTADDLESIETSSNDKVFSKYSNVMITTNSDNNYVETSEKIKTKKKAIDVIDMPLSETSIHECAKMTVPEQTISNARLEAGSNIETIPVQYFSKQRKFDNQEKHMELNSKEISFEREWKRKKNNLEEINCDSVINEITTVDTRVDAITDGFSQEEKRRGRKNQTKHKQKMLDNDSSAKKKCEKSNIEPDKLSLPDDHSFEKTFCEEQKSKPCEAVGMPENSSCLNLPRASKIEEKIDTSYLSTGRNHQYAKDVRKLSKAERIVLKARLLKDLRNETVVHGFVGSNLSSIRGYGNVGQKSYEY